jgi:hypothetical protein
MDPVLDKWYTILVCVYDVSDATVNHLGYEALSNETTAREVIRATIVTWADKYDATSGRIRGAWKPVMTSLLNSPLGLANDSQVYAKLQDFPFAEPDHPYNFAQWVWDELWPGEDWRQQPAP